MNTVTIKKLDTGQCMEMITAPGPKVSGQERTCLNCACTDSLSCKGGCFWIFISLDHPVGICSQCYEISRWIKPDEISIRPSGRKKG